MHRAVWPDAAWLREQAGPGDEAVLTAAAAAIGAIRKAKSQARLPMKNPVQLLILTAGQPRVDALAAAGDDVRSAGRVAVIELRATDGAEPVHDVVVQYAPPLPSCSLTGSNASSKDDGQPPVGPRMG